MSLPVHKVYITENHPNGKATFRPDEVAPVQAMGPLMQQTLIYSAPTPLTIDDKADLEHNIATWKISPITFFPPQDATAACIVDFAPGSEGMMHKTKSLDYVIVLEGALELELLGGEKKVIKKGEVVIQRECESRSYLTCDMSQGRMSSHTAAYHNWRNLSKTEPARFFVVAVGAKAATGGEMIPYAGDA